MKEKTYVEDVNRSIYDIRNEEKDVYRVKEGLTPEIVDQISKEKHDPDWMREFRQEALKVYNEMTMPDWAVHRRLKYGRDCYLCTPQHADECEMVRGSDRYQKYV